MAAELLGRVRAELPMIGELGEREQLLVSAWLTGLRSARTRRAYAADVAAWLGWLAGRETGALAAGRVHVDLWAATQLDDGAAASSVRRRLSALSSFYRYCAAVGGGLVGDGPLSGHRGVGAQVPGAGYAGPPAVEVTEELLDRRAAVAELGAELRALADLVTRTEAGADVLRDSAQRLREVAPALRERIRGIAEPGFGG